MILKLIFVAIILLNLLVSYWVLNSNKLKIKRRMLILFGIWLIPVFGAAFAWIKIFVSDSSDDRSDPKLGNDELGLAQDGLRKAPDFMQSLKRFFKA